MNRKPYPLRMCIGCRERFFKTDLRRYTLDAGAVTREDPEQLAPGRGFYVCAKAECAGKLQKRLARQDRQRTALKRADAAKNAQGSQGHE
ncbi:MAG: DUF448 domain-containing protein [Desulfovibrionaceae bacterium]|nr:DUF448 domain-containing protein [Desulfovibrionaceae bacterium]